MPYACVPSPPPTTQVHICCEDMPSWDRLALDGIPRLAGSDAVVGELLCAQPERRLLHAEALVLRGLSSATSVKGDWSEQDISNVVHLLTGVSLAASPLPHTLVETALTGRTSRDLAELVCRALSVDAPPPPQGVPPRRGLSLACDEPQSASRAPLRSAQEASVLSRVTCALQEIVQRPVDPEVSLSTIGLDSMDLMRVVEAMQTIGEVPLQLLLEEPSARQIAEAVERGGTSASPSFSEDHDGHPPPSEEDPSSLPRSSLLSQRDEELRAADAAAVRRCDNLTHGCVTRPPAKIGFVVVGAGLYGLVTTARLLEIEGVTACILERSHHIGGVWRAAGNYYSRVNSAEPSYRLPIARRGRFNENQSPRHQILLDCAELVVQKSLVSKLHTAVEVESAVQDAGQHGYSVRGRCLSSSSSSKGRSENIEAFCTWCDSVVVCCNPRLGHPRHLVYPGEDDAFRGTVRTGLGGGANDVQWADARVLLLGHGPFAIENLRHALLRGAVSTTCLCRQHLLLLPEVWDFVAGAIEDSTVRGEEALAGAVLASVLKKTYALSSATPPESWTGSRSLDGPPNRASSVSDIYFIAHHLRLAGTVCGEAATFERSAVLTLTGQRLRSDVVIKCVGFEATHDHLHGMLRIRDGARSCPRNGLLDADGLWLLSIPPDKALPFVSELDGVDFIAKMIAHCWSKPGMTNRLFQLVMSRTPAAADPYWRDLRTTLKLVTTELAPIAGMLSQHQQERRGRFLTRYPSMLSLFEANRLQWSELHRRFERGEQPHVHLAYTLDELLPLISAHPPTSPSRVGILASRVAVRVLTLHGEASDCDSMRLMIEAMGWAAGRSVEFVCINAPHVCAPKPHLYRRLAEGGHYSRDHYYSWGVTTSTAALTTSTEHVRHALREHRCTAIAGICDGSIVAALVAMQQSDLQFYLNFCAGPLSQCAAQLPTPASISVPSLHVLSTKDEMFDYASLNDVPSRCRGKSMTVSHTQGHVLPPCKGHIAACFNELVPVQLDAPSPSTEGARADAPTISLKGDVAHTAGVSQSHELSDHPIDSLDLLNRVRSDEMQPRDAVRAHIDFIVAVCVVFHHSRLKFLLSKLGALRLDDRVHFEAFQTLYYGSMPAAIILLGVDAHRRVATSSQFARRTAKLLFLLALLTVSGLPSAVEGLLHARLKHGIDGTRDNRQAEKAHFVTTERLVTPLWFIVAIVMWECAAEVSRKLNVLCILPVIALLLHFACYAANCPWPFHRDGSLSCAGLCVGPHNSLLATLNYIVMPSVSRGWSFWWLYASVPYVLPHSFPLVLPGEGLVPHGTPRNVRLFWTAMLALLVWFVAAEAEMARPPHGTTGMLTAAIPQCFYAYRCATVGVTTPCTSWAFKPFFQDVASCLVQLVVTFGVAALVPRRKTPFARAGQMALIIMCAHEYALSIMDHSMAMLSATLCSSFGVSPLLVVLMCCTALALGVAQGGMLIVFASAQLVSLVLPAVSVAERALGWIRRCGESLWLSAQGRARGRAPYLSCEDEGSHLIRDVDCGAHSFGQFRQSLCDNSTEAYKQPRWSSLARSVRAVLPYAVGWLAMMALVVAINAETARHQQSPTSHAASHHGVSASHHIIHNTSHNVSSRTTIAPVARMPAVPLPSTADNESTPSCWWPLAVGVLHPNRILAPSRKPCELMTYQLLRDTDFDAACRIRCKRLPACVGYVLMSNGTARHSVCKLGACSGPLVPSTVANTTILRTCRLGACRGPLLPNKEANSTIPRDTVCTRPPPHPNALARDLR